jgi:hypothetical protein
MPTTTNFGWTTPADTDLVKDGALAIRTLGNGIDTSMVDLKGGTTGQNLRKATNTDLDFTWAGDATNTVIDAEGDLLVGDSADTLQRLAIGTTGQVLTVDTTIDGKIKWASASSNAGLIHLKTTSFSAVSAQSLEASTFTSDYTNYKLQITLTSVSSGGDMRIRMRASGSDNTTANYMAQYLFADSSTLVAGAENSATSWKAGTIDTSRKHFFSIDIFSPQATEVTAIQLWENRQANSTSNSLWFQANSFNATTSFDSLTFYSSGGGTISGTYQVYAYKN